MTDAGRKLIPEGLNKTEDLPKIEAYFQEVCQKEPKFLLRRKLSYPGAFRRRRNRKKGGSCRDKASSADEADTPPDRFQLQPGPSGRFDLQRMKREFFFGKQEATSPPSESETNENVLIDTLQKVLYQGKSLNHQELLEKLQLHLANIEKTKMEERRKAVQFEGDITDISLLDTLRRYFARSTSREKVISDMLTDRKKLEKLYFELRQARGFMAGSRGSASGRQIWKGTYRSEDGARNISRLSGFGSSGESSSGYGIHYESTSSGSQQRMSRYYYRGKHLSDMAEEDSSTPESNTPSSPPPTVEIEPERSFSYGTQTDSLSAKSLSLLEDELKKLKLADAKENEDGSKSPPKDGAPRRSSLVDNDDVSPSVSDTIKRYLRMARKKSADGDKIDRFKRVNYDRNLRNIKAKGEITKISDDDGLDKGAQTDQSWVEAFKNLKMDYEPEIVSGVSSRSSLTEETVSPTSPTSKSFLSSGQNFLSSLLHGLHDRTSVSAGGMQKSRSSTSVVQQGSRLVAKKIWKSRSKSQSRATPSATSTWTPQVK